MSTIWMEVPTVAGNIPWFTVVYVVGFIAAVVIGSIAWYNSKRPPGWEGAERPNIVPKVQNQDDEEGTSDA
ncbi:MAG: hypothetical protein VKK04_08580 [Synechococcales bacterium]|nr:hypothetical protein [Synechococcales bacterium]